MKKILYTLSILSLGTVGLMSCGSGEYSDSSEVVTTDNQADMDSAMAMDKDVTEMDTMAMKDKQAMKSPKRDLDGQIGDAKIHVTYGSPSVRGRKIWGGLTPYDTIWRTGANEATTMEFSKDVMIEGKKLPAGKYAFFTIPHADMSWDVIFNKTSDQWGAYDYDKGQDALRVSAVADKGSTDMEAMTFDVKSTGDKTGTITLMWEKMVLPIDVKTM